MPRLPIAFLALLAAASTAAAQPSDAKKTSTALLTEAARFESEGAFEKAIDKAQKAVDKAVADQRKDVAARALQVLGRSNENLNPEKIADAQAAYGRIVAEFGDQEPVAGWAKDKISWKGIDVWIRQFAAALQKERDEERAIFSALNDIKAPETDPRIVELRGKLTTLKTWAGEQKAAFWAKAQPLDKDAVPGLMTGLAHKDGVVRAACAEFIAETADEPGIASVVSRLADDAARPGAALALSKIFGEFASAKKFDEEAAKIMEDLQDIKAPSDRSKALVEKNMERARALQQKANEIRKNIPAALDSPKIQDALKDVLGNEKQPAGQIEAAKALESVGDLAGPLVDALLTGLKSNDRNVRQACCVAAGAVDTTSNADKRKLAERLIEIVKLEPEVENKADGDHANDPAVRGAAATSLGRIGIIKAIPALIDALDDNSADVQRRAHEALIAITAKDLGYESEPHLSDAGFINPDPKARKMEEEKDKRAKQAELRKKGIEAWKQWWTDTEGIVTLVERFWKFAGSWKAGDPTRLFDKDEYIAETKARAYVFSDPEEALKRAERNVGRFQKRKDFLQSDAIDEGSPAVAKLMKYVGGDLADLEKGLPKDVVDKARASTRMFVAESIAKLAKDAGGDTVAALRDMVGGGASRDQKAGAALALGFLPKDMVTGQERDTLDKRGLADGDPVVRAAAARALKSVGDASNAAGLTAVATNLAGDNLAAQQWALRAITAIRPKNPDTVKALGDLIGETEKASTESLTRELGCDALGAIGDPSAITELYLLRARRDLAQNVRDGAQRAIRAIASGNESVAAALLAVMKNEKNDRKSSDRVGAALAMGDMGVAKYAMGMVWRLVDQNPPLLLKDPDPAVRAAVCRGLGTMGDNAKFRDVGEKLLEAIATEDSEQIRRDAYSALRAINGADIPLYDAAATAEMRRTQLQDIKAKWWAAAAWKAAPQ